MESFSKLFYLNVSYMWCSELDIFIIFLSFECLFLSGLNPPAAPAPVPVLRKQFLVHSSSHDLSSCASFSVIIFEILLMQCPGYMDMYVSCIYCISCTF